MDNINHLLSITNAKLYATTESSSTNYLEITTSGIKYSTNSSKWWAISDSPNGLLITASLQGCTIDTEGDITLDTSVSGRDINLNGYTVLLENHNYGTKAPGETGFPITSPSPG